MSGKESQTRLVGLIGWPVHHSLSPAMHNAAFAALGLDYSYLPLPVDPASEQHLARALIELRAFGFAGANVTIPYKERVVPYLDRLSPSAEIIGAVNVISVETAAVDACRLLGDTTDACRLLGDNTDALGFIGDLDDRQIQVWGANALLLGSGGAARAVAYALAERGAARLILAARQVQKAEQIAERLSGRFGNSTFEARPIGEVGGLDPCQIALVVNCTSVGLAGREDAPWLDAVPFSPGQTAYDLVYGTTPTPFLERALECGASAISGHGMLVRQAAASFEIWTGLKAPIEVMREAACGSYERVDG